MSPAFGGSYLFTMPIYPQPEEQTWDRQQGSDQECHLVKVLVEESSNTRHGNG